MGHAANAFDGEPMSPPAAGQVRRLRTRVKGMYLSTLDQWRGPGRRPDTAAMPKHPSPSQPEPPQTTWTIYKFASRLQWLGTVQATDKREAIEKAAKEFRLDPAKLMAERQR